MNENPAVNYRIDYFPERRRRNERWSVLDASGKPIMHGTKHECDTHLAVLRRYGYGTAAQQQKSGAAA